MRRAAQGTFDLVFLLAVVVGLPVLLIVAVGQPIPTALPTPQAVDEHPRLILQVLSLILWPAWLIASSAVFTEWAARSRRVGGAPALRMAGPLQPFLRRRVAGVALLLAGSWQAERPAAPLPLTELVASARPDEATELQQAEMVRGWREPDTATTHPIAPEAPIAKWVLTVPNDSLWDLAERHLGDGRRFAELVELNKGLRQPDRCCLEPPGDFIRPNWLILMPPDAVSAQEGPVPVEFVLLRSGQSHAGEQDAPVVDPEPMNPTLAAAPSPAPAFERAPSTPIPTSSLVQDDAAPAAPPVGAPVDGVRLPSGAFVAGSFAAGFASAVLLTELRRRRTWRPRGGSLGSLVVASDESPTMRKLRRRRPSFDSDAPELAITTDFGMAGPRGRAFAALPDGTERSLDLLQYRGIALSGPGAEPTARAVVVASLVASGLDEVSVLTDDATADTLFGDINCPVVRREPSTDAVMTTAHAEVLRRARMMEQRDASDFADYVAQNPDEPLAEMIVVLSYATDAPRLAAIASGGQPRGLSVIVLNEWSNAELQVTVDGDLRTSANVEELSDLSAYSLVTSEAVEVLAALDYASLPTEPSPVSGRDVSPDDVLEPAPQVPDHSRVSAPIRVTALGGLSVVTGESEVRITRGTSREALAYFLLRPKGATTESVLEALWPEVEPDLARKRFWKALSDLRKDLREATGLSELTAIEPIGGDRYRLIPASFDIDVWRFESALQDASGGAEVSALERAVQAYSGDLFHGFDYDWARDARARLRSRALEAVSRLAQLHVTDGRPEVAVRALDKGITFDPYAEELYARLIELQCRAGDKRSARHTFARLKAQLAEIEQDPMESTAAPLGRLDDDGRASP